ncbi:Major facilitator superfamily domain general substrate transporter [Penicillium cf. griseofulvum]|uniref:Major facilitator superfamily domain general substrate transporter n=1 Tax=Penicillium cf. griseofulvum TaxID=2972120 RepID=A0A9W9IWY4_9EURO|nr:Major facilitator superfamily domain general substrate transporter [Penicillium cf. griseofulvum]KAJ5429426.1 Major facilitator superfamily domain general substrate transporter [Penicillium cf. griseofulvum]KAJ5436791.1 Major facilitator superfamily domain general substrate transporter [Penicillium cf. griseofulvum]
MRLSPSWYQFLVGVFASLGSFLYGYDLGVIAEVLVCDSFKTKFEADDTQKGLVVSLFTAGACVGAGFAGPSGDYLGRRRTISLGCLIFTLGGGLQTGAVTIDYLYSGRFLAGLGVGFLTMMIPLYQAEICHPSIRGRVTALQQFMLGIGALCATWIGYGTYTGFAKTNSAQWQLPLGLQIAPAVFLGLLISFFPESPRWLIDHGRAEEGLRTLAKLHAHGDENDPWVQAEFAQIQESIDFEHENEAKSYLELFTHRSSFRRLFLCCALQASGQMTGVSAIQYYSPQIYGQIGISDQDTLKYQAINSIIALIGQFLCMMYIDRFGRRWTLIGGNLGNMVTFIVATALLAKFPPSNNNNGAHWGFIIMTWLYNFSFSATCGPLSWIIPAEVFDTRTRAKGVSIATMVSFAFNTMIGQVTPIAMTRIGYRFYILFVICNFTNAVFFWLLLPETKRVPLEEMNQMFTNAPWIVPGSRKEEYMTHDLERKVEEQEVKQNAMHVE